MNGSDLLRKYKLSLISDNKLSEHELKVCHFIIETFNDCKSNSNPNHIKNIFYKNGKFVFECLKNFTNITINRNIYQEFVILCNYDSLIIADWIKYLYNVQ